MDLLEKSQKLPITRFDVIGERLTTMLTNLYVYKAMLDAANREAESELVKQWRDDIVRIRSAISEEVRKLQS